MELSEIEKAAKEWISNAYPNFYKKRRTALGAKIKHYAEAMAIDAFIAGTNFNLKEKI